MKLLIRASVLAVLASSTILMAPEPALACTPSAAASHDAFFGNISCPSRPDSTQNSAITQGQSGGISPVLIPVLPTPNANIGACGAAATVDPLACAAPAAQPAAARVPQVTPGMVLQAFQRIPVPHLRSQTQPDNKTLVNFDTIFYVQAQPFQRTVRLLGKRVTLDITPSAFTWQHGDGTATTTSSPGAKYPSKDVVHRYQQAQVTVAHSVIVEWTARYRVGNQPWQPVPGTVTTTGPPTNLRIAEATPVLTGER